MKVLRQKLGTVDDLLADYARYSNFSNGVDKLNSLNSAEEDSVEIDYCPKHPIGKRLGTVEDLLADYASYSTFICKKKNKSNTKGVKVKKTMIKTIKSNSDNSLYRDTHNENTENNINIMEVNCDNVTKENKKCNDKKKSSKGQTLIYVVKKKKALGKKIKNPRLAKIKLRKKTNGLSVAKASFISSKGPKRCSIERICKNGRINEISKANSNDKQLEIQLEIDDISAQEEEEEEEEEEEDHSTIEIPRDGLDHKIRYNNDVYNMVDYLYESKEIDESAHRRLSNSSFTMQCNGRLSLSPTKDQSRRQSRQSSKYFTSQEENFPMTPPKHYRTPSKTPISSTPVSELQVFSAVKQMINEDMFRDIASDGEIDSKSVSGVNSPTVAHSPSTAEIRYMQSDMLEDAITRGIIEANVSHELSNHKLGSIQYIVQVIIKDTCEEPTTYDGSRMLLLRQYKDFAILKGNLREKGIAQFPVIDDASPIALNDWLRSVLSTRCLSSRGAIKKFLSL